MNWTDELHAVEQHIAEAKNAAVTAGKDELLRLLQASQAKINGLIQDIQGNQQQ